MEKIEFEHIDHVGEHTLNAISEADKFNRWMYETIKPYCKGKVLEVGSGIGNISDFFIQDGFDIMLTDIRQGYCDKLEASFKGQKSFLGTEVVDLNDPEFDNLFKKHLGQYDTVFALNVVEHIYDDFLALQNCKKLLRDGGHLIILVPAYRGLFNMFDVQLGHYRRYNLSRLSDLFSKIDFDIIHKQYFNFIGIFGWYINGHLLKRKHISNTQMKLYNLLVPFIKIFDRVIFNSVGLSSIMVGRKSIHKE